MRFGKLAMVTIGAILTTGAMASFAEEAVKNVPAQSQEVSKAKQLKELNAQLKTLEKKITTDTAAALDKEIADLKKAIAEKKKGRDQSVKQALEASAEYKDLKAKCAALTTEVAAERQAEKAAKAEKAKKAKDEAKKNGEKAVEAKPAADKAPAK